MRILILSCNCGAGHNSCAQAIKEFVENKGEYCDIEDALSFVSPRLSDFISWGHVWMYRHLPRLFSWGYAYAERNPALLREGSRVYKLITGGCERLHSFILRGNYDAVLCTHVFASMMINHIGKTAPIPQLQSGFIATDYTCSPGNEGSSPDFCFIPAESLRDEYLRCGVTAQSIVASGIPVRQMFYRHREKAAAKQQFGIDPQHRHLLMMCGSMGCGPLRQLAEQLSRQLPEDAEMSIVCGSNRKLYDKMRQRYAESERVHVLAYVDDMSLLLDSADLYLSKPGGISVSEAAVKELPMVLIDAVAGCEEYNRSFFTLHGAAATADSVEGLAAQCLHLLSDEVELARMRQAMRALAFGNAAELIYNSLRYPLQQSVLLQKKVGSR